MELKFLKPTTPSQRHLILLNKTNLSKNSTLKTKIKGKKNNSGRNNEGKITVYHKGNGHKQKYRKINFHRTGLSKGVVCSIEYDPNRNSNIASVYDFINQKLFYIIASKNLTVGNIVESGPNAKPTNGNSLPISKIPTGYSIHNVSYKPFQKSKISRSAGTFSILEEKGPHYAKIKMPSEEKKIVPVNSYATIGVVSNELYFMTKIGKAGRSRWLNIRPTVRGVAMNPIDHPHGGGEGKKSGKKLTPWSKPTRKKYKK